MEDEDVSVVFICRMMERMLGEFKFLYKFYLRKMRRKEELALGEKNQINIPIFLSLMGDFNGV